MFTLNLLGGAAFHGRNGPVSGRAAHRRRVALLAILSVARGRTVGRERIVGLLWPDQTAARARHLLSESLYVLRKELGADAFVSAGDEVGLNGGVVWSDLEAFEEAIEAGEPERAARLYRGPFLDGFFVADAPEFERWAEGERARLAYAHARALECLAAAREGEGRPAEAAEWWRRLAVLDPYDSRIGMRLMLALEAAGQRAAALWFAETHTAFLRDELGVEPEDDFAEMVERLRTEPVRVPVPPHVSPLVPDGAAGEAEPSGERNGPGIPEDSGRRVETAGAAHLADPARAIDPADPAGAAVVAEPAAPVISMASEGSPRAAEPIPSTGSTGSTEPAGSIEGVESAETVESPESRDSTVRSASTESLDGSDAPGGEGGIVRHGREERSRTDAGRRRLRAAGWAALAGGLATAAVFIALLASPGAPAPEARPAGYDPHRIAVLYFDDHSPGGELGYLASGLTEMLIHQLSGVEALTVVSRNGVKPYREGAVSFDSLVADLRVGSVVEGSVQRSGDEVRVTVQLVDAATNSHLESRTVVHRLGDVFALEDAVADSVSGFLRRRLGQQVKVRRMRAETRSSDAWRWVMEAEQARDAAARFLRSGASQDAASAARALARADSLLAAAERADPAWTRPTVLRGWVALRRGGPAAAAPYAERVLARTPGNALALELRGTLLLAAVAAAVDSAGQGARVERAEADLRAAVAAEPGLASAWKTLGQLLRFRGRFAEADAAGHRALAEDAWLDGAGDILNGLFYGALLTGAYARADSLCARGRERYRGDWRFVECRLILLRADTSRPADPALALRLLDELERLDPPEQVRGGRRAYSRLFRPAVAAAVLARAGDTRRARSMLDQARRAAEGSAELQLSLAYDAAYVQLAAGARDSARALLEWSFARRPALRAYAARDPLFRTLLAPAPPGPTGTPTGADGTRRRPDL